MYVVRYNGKIKRGRMQDAIELFRTRRAATGNIDRIYANVFGDNDLLAIEIEFDDIEAAAQHVKFVEAAEFQEEITAQGWYDISTGNIVELWKVID